MLHKKRNPADFQRGFLIFAWERRGFLLPRRYAAPPLEGEAYRGAVVGRNLRHECAVPSGWAFWASLPRRFALPPLERGIKGESKKFSILSFSFHSLLDNPIRNTLGILSHIAIIHPYHLQTYRLHLPVALGIPLLCLGGEM